MPLPQVKIDESELEFVNRCTFSPEMVDEFPNPLARVAVCKSLYKHRNDAPSVEADAAPVKKNSRQSGTIKKNIENFTESPNNEKTGQSATKPERTKDSPSETLEK